MTPALKDADRTVRRENVDALGEIGRRLLDSVGDLADKLNDDDAGVRAATEALGDMGSVPREADREVVPVLVELRKKDRDEVRRAAFDALKKIAPNELRAGRP